MRPYAATRPRASPLSRPRHCERATPPLGRALQYPSDPNRSQAIYQGKHLSLQASATMPLWPHCVSLVGIGHLRPTASTSDALGSTCDTSTNLPGETLYLRSSRHECLIYILLPLHAYPVPRPDRGTLTTERPICTLYGLCELSMTESKRLTRHCPQCRYHANFRNFEPLTRQDTAFTKLLPFRKALSSQTFPCIPELVTSTSIS
jgi:hypothetical protein